MPEHAGVYVREGLLFSNIFFLIRMMLFRELYCRLDVLLLAECVLSFREEIYAEFTLDCCHYISLPQLAFSAMLKSTGVAIECMNDIDMILFFEQAIRWVSRLQSSVLVIISLIHLYILEAALASLTADIALQRAL